MFIPPYLNVLLNIAEISDSISFPNFFESEISAFSSSLIKIDLRFGKDPGMDLTKQSDADRIKENQNE
jgi:hypothetical protein